MNTNNAENRIGYESELEPEHKPEHELEHELEPKPELKTKPGPIKYQIYLGDELQEPLERYIQDNYAPGTHVKTAIIRKAVMEFLRKEGYYSPT